MSTETQRGLMVTFGIANTLETTTKTVCLARVLKYKAVPQKAQRPSKPKKKDNETKQRGLLKPPVVIQAYR